MHTLCDLVAFLPLANSTGIKIEYWTPCGVQVHHDSACQTPVPGHFSKSCFSEILISPKRISLLSCISIVTGDYPKWQLAHFEWWLIDIGGFDFSPQLAKGLVCVARLFCTERDGIFGISFAFIHQSFIYSIINHTAVGRPSHKFFSNCRCYLFHALRIPCEKFCWIYQEYGIFIKRIFEVEMLIVLR